MENERSLGEYMEKTCDSSGGVVERLAKKFDLELPGKFTQDWEYIVAKVEQLDQYIAYYQSGALCGLEKELLMRIILQAYDDYTAFGEQEDVEDIYKTPIRECLQRDYLLHKETIAYWALEDYEMDDVFSITPFVREIKLQMEEKEGS